MMTFKEALIQARESLTETIIKNKYNKQGIPNILLVVEVESEHVDESKKMDGVFKNIYDIEKIGNDRIRCKIVVTKEYADEILDMIDRNTIKINQIYTSQDLDYDTGDSFKYTKQSVNLRAIKNHLTHLEKHMFLRNINKKAL